MFTGPRDSLGHGTEHRSREAVETVPFSHGSPHRCLVYKPDFIVGACVCGEAQSAETSVPSGSPASAGGLGMHTAVQEGPYCAQVNNGPQRCQCPHPQNLRIHSPCGRRHSAAVINCRVLRWGDCLDDRVLCSHRVLRRGSFGEEEVPPGAGTGVMGSQARDTSARIAGRGVQGFCWRLWRSKAYTPCCYPGRPTLDV